MSDTKQPKWKLLGNLGDRGFLDHGGFFVYEDETGVYSPEVEMIVSENPELVEAEKWTVYRFSIDRCTFISGVLSDNQFHPEMHAWFAGELQAISVNSGADMGQLIDWLCSDNALVRAAAYQVLVDYYGPFEFDQEPLRFTSRAEMEERYEEELAFVRRS